MSAQDSEASFELLAGLTRRLASSAHLDEIVDTVLREIVALGFESVWLALLDEQHGDLVTLQRIIDGRAATHELARVSIRDTRRPIGLAFREMRVVNVVSPELLGVTDDDGAWGPPGAMALPRDVYEQLRGHPFACGPLVGSRGQPVGAFGVSSYLGHQPIPDELFSRGLLRAFLDHLGIALERALHLARLERLNAELVKAQETLLRDARAKAVGELASAVAHDLNNLTGVALLAARIGRRSPRDALDALPRIESANRAIGELVARLRRVARNDFDRDADEALLGQIVDDITAMVAPVLQEQSIALEVDVQPVAPVYCDPVLLHQVILNLVLNARDALREVPAAQRRLCVRVFQLPGDGTVRLVVRDSGPGIAPEVLPQLFRAFVTTKGAEHVGLGLAAAHGSLQQFGAQLRGSNAAEGGAVFELSLRARPVHGAAKATPAAHPCITPRPDARILAVDDDRTIVSVIRDYLKPLGCHIATATSSAAALELAEQVAFDLILCDVSMPMTSGLEICQLLRDRGYSGRFVLMTGWEGNAIRADRRALLCDRVLEKPFVSDELLEVVDALLPAQPRIDGGLGAPLA